METVADERRAETRDLKAVITAFLQSYFSDTTVLMSSLERLKIAILRYSLQSPLSPGSACSGPPQSENIRETSPERFSEIPSTCLSQTSLSSLNPEFSPG